MINNLDYDKSLNLMLKDNDKADLILDFISKIPEEVKEAINIAILANNENNSYQGGFFKILDDVYEYYIFDETLHIDICMKKTEQRNHIIKLTIYKFKEHYIDNNYYVSLGDFLISNDYIITGFYEKYFYDIKNDKDSKDLYSIRESHYTDDDYCFIKTYSVCKEEVHEKVRKKI